MNPKTVIIDIFWASKSDLMYSELTFQLTMTPE